MGELNDRGGQLEEPFEEDPLLPNLPKYEIQLGDQPPHFPQTQQV